LVPGRGATIRMLAIGESTVAGVGLARSDETVAATTARALARRTARPVKWHGHGLSGATVSVATAQLLPQIAAEMADLLVISFGVNDTLAYRSPAAFADDLAALVTAVRRRIGEAAAVVITGVAPLACFPALPWPLRTILNWRSVALQESAERLADRLPRVVVERFSEPLGPHLFAGDGFHPNREAHALWGEEIASLALPLLREPKERIEATANLPACVADPASSGRKRLAPAILAFRPRRGAAQAAHGADAARHGISLRDGHESAVAERGHRGAAESLSGSAALCRRKSASPSPVGAWRPSNQSPAGVLSDGTAQPEQ
jgi:lysophospholipase L1-like esterase